MKFSLTEDQITAIKKEGRKIHKIIESRSADFGYPNPKVPEDLLPAILEFFSYTESLTGYKVVESPMLFCENSFFGGDPTPVYELFTKIDPIPINQGTDNV